MKRDDGHSEPLPTGLVTVLQIPREMMTMTAVHKIIQRMVGRNLTQMLPTKRSTSILRCGDGYWRETAGESSQTNFLTTRHTTRVCIAYCQRFGLIVLRLAHPLDLCYDNCIRKKNCGDRFESVYDLISFLDTSCGRSPISRPADDNSDLEPTTLAKDWGNLCVGNRLAIRRRVLEDWRYDCWKKNYLEAIPNWGYASKYGHEVPSLLKDADHRHQLESPI